MKRFWIICVFMLAVVVAEAATKRALVIGIGDYPVSSGWAKINGDKDIPVVRDMLISNGFDRKNIDVLCNDEATRAGISSAFARLATVAQRGDVVYIHFSGHGQQIIDVDGDELDDGKDEAWIPYDAYAVYQENVYEGENHILDDELYTWCYAIKQKIGAEGNLIVVADACHSGGGSRGLNDTECIRGSFIDDLADASLTFMRKLLPGSRSEASAAVTQGPIDWVFISACKDYQSNQEYKKAGSLTAAMASIQGQLTKLNYDELKQAIQKWMSDHLPRTQTPTIDRPEGPTRQTLL